jgi:hypothetical protein
MTARGRWQWTGPVMAMVALGAGCGESPDVPPIEQGCVSTKQYFTDEVWNPFMSTSCFSCHNAQGIASSSELVLQSPNQPGFLDANLAIVGNVAQFERNGTSIMLLKPTAKIDHGGGVVFDEDSPQYKALAELVRQLRAPVVCEVGDDNAFAGVNLLDNASTYRKATLAIAGRLPTEDERLQVDGGDVDDLDAALDGLLEEEAFYVRLKEVYNDLFLTEKYISGQRGTELLDEERFPDRFWYMEGIPQDFSQRTPEQEAERRRLEAGTNRGVAREALELVAYAARNNLPFTEIVKADYMMVNPFSARSYGVADQVTFDDPENPDEFQPVSVPDYPHAGVLTSPMWLNRFPTTETNRNRHRAAKVFKFFLATDILKIGDRPIDSGSIAGFNPTLNDPNCTVCHANIDPIAGTFQNWTDRGAFEPPTDGWFGDMFAPGFKDIALPFDQRFEATTFLGEHIATDPLFALATVHTIFTGLTGREPVFAPTDSNDPDFDAKQRAFVAQDVVFQAIAKKFVDSGFNIKVVVKEVVKSPYFRAASVQETIATPENRAFLSSLGSARFLTPELLDRKVEAVVGYPWTVNFGGGRRFLLDINEYLIYYGGIDSDAVTSRITSPNGLMAAVGSRMAFEMACRAGPRDFTLPPEQRLLFPVVEATYEPEDENGFAIPDAELAIKHNIQHLFARILDQKVSLEDEELLAAYDLWKDTWKTGRANIAEQRENQDLPGSCQVNNDYFTNDPLPDEQRLRRDSLYTIRAWNAVVAYMLSDARFLHD